MEGCHHLGTRDWYLMHYSNPFVTRGEKHTHTPAATVPNATMTMANFLAADSRVCNDVHHAGVTMMTTRGSTILPAQRAAVHVRGGPLLPLALLPPCLLLPLLPHYWSLPLLPPTPWDLYVSCPLLPAMGSLALLPSLPRHPIAAAVSHLWPPRDTQTMIASAMSSSL